jgi:radical SAM superfamily enzyme YgiQ (UPF0313 family)
MELDTLKKSLSSLKADIYGLTAMTHEIGSAGKLAEAIKAAHPDATVVVGGCHSIALPRDTLADFPGFDVAISGEGEVTGCQLVKALDEGRLLDGIEGLVFRRDGEIVVNPRREMNLNMNEFPMPAWDLFPHTDIYPVMTARGCPFHCVFCMQVMGHQVRYRSPENVVDEIDVLINDFGAKEVWFYDETFTLNKDRVHRILDLMMDRGHHKKIRWLAQTRVNRCDEELFKKMAHAGCFEIDFGIESGNQEILHAIGKDFSLDEAREIIPMAKKAGIKVANLFILGHPNETHETLRDTIDFAAELNSDRVSFGIMVPYPGTEVARMAANGEGGYRLLSTDWADYNKYLGNALEFDTISRKELERLQVKAYLKFYLHNKRFLDLGKLFAGRWREGVAILKRVAAPAS